jgi:hypothetical protein
VRSSVGGALLVVILCAVTTGCTAGVYGAAVTAETPAATPTTASSQRFNGWEPAFNSELSKAPMRFHRNAVLVRPTILAAGLGAAMVLAGHPQTNSRWRFECLIKGSRNLAGPFSIQLQALAHNARTWKKVAAETESLGSRWRRYSVSGEVELRNAIALRVVVWARNSVPVHSWIALDRPVVKRISAGGT